jgi:hypothetical protein
METPIPLPSSPGNREISWILDSAVSRSVSPFSLTEQVYAWPGQRWSVVMSLPTMSVEAAREWQAFFAEINGMGGTFYVGDAAFLQVVGVGYGAPEVDGDFTGGLAVPTRGWTPNMANVLTKGQRIEIAGRMRMVTEAANSDAAGKALIKFWPQARGLTDGMEVVWLNPKGVFRASSVPAFTWNASRLQEGFQFSATEVILP